MAKSANATAMKTHWIFFPLIGLTLAYFAGRGMWYNFGHECEVQYIVITTHGGPFLEQATEGLIPDGTYQYLTEYKNVETGAFFRIECIPPCEFPRDSAIFNLLNQAK